jgi:hypothetical protein
MAAPRTPRDARQCHQAVFSGGTARHLVRYRALGIWGPNPILPLAGYARLVSGLVSGGFARGTPFELAVDNSLAEQVVAEDPPSM